MNKLTITVGKLLFQFDSFEEWVGTAQAKYHTAGTTHHWTICVDDLGRVCVSGKEFMRARDERCFPVKVYEVTV
jgi:hypothetical protein